MKENFLDETILGFVVSFQFLLAASQEDKQKVFTPEIVYLAT